MNSLKAFILFAFIIFSFACFSQKHNDKISFRDSTDNAIDMSDWLLNKKGFLVIPSIITEPAVGYGGSGAAIYFHSSYADRKAPPSMSGVFGLGTENGTWGVGIFHVGYWKKDRIRYMGAFGRMNINVGFYGSGNLGLIDFESVNLNMDSWLVVQQLKFRIGETNIFSGGRYIYYNTSNTFDASIDIPEFNGINMESTLSEATAIINYDTMSLS